MDKEKFLNVLQKMEEAYDRWPQWKRAQLLDTEPRPLEGYRDSLSGPSAAVQEDQNYVNVQPAARDRE